MSGTPNKRNPFSVFCDNTDNIQKVKRGFRAATTPQVCIVSFQYLPLWLWTLRPSEWSTVLISVANENLLKSDFRSTWDCFSHRLQPCDLSDRSLKPIVWWDSGSEEYLRGITPISPGLCPRVVCMVGGPRRTPRSTDMENWYSLLHKNVGGCTNARGVFGLRGLHPLSLPADLPRTLAHVIKHSLRGKPCSERLSDPHYKIGDRLTISRIQQPLLFASAFSGSGWTTRPLDPVELELAFELPEFVRWRDNFAHEVVPLQLLRSVMESILSQVTPIPLEPGPKRQKIHSTARKLASVLRPTVLDQHWLPSLQRWLPGSWSNTAISDRAVKSDGASIDFFPWNQRISLVFPQVRGRIIAYMERLCHLRWCRMLTKSLTAYLNLEYGSDWVAKMPNLRQMATGGRGWEGNSDVTIKRQRTRQDPLNRGGLVKGTDQDLLQDVEKGAQVLRQVLRSSWWEWSFGSSLFFWRWNGSDQRRSARDGMDIYVASELPHGLTRIKPPRFSPEDRTLVASKIDGMLQRSYLEEGFVRSKVHYFAVPKGDDDIRVVFDGTSSGLNETLWAPNFYLPTSRAVSALLTFSSWMADVDFGEMFHNFFVANQIRKHAGVDVAPLSPDLKTTLSRGDRGGRLVRWTRLFMGMRPSPYNAVRYYYWGEEFVRGNPDCKENPMRYDRVILNLPCMESYNPELPKVMKWNDQANDNVGAVAGDVVTFVDDGRITGHSKENCHEVHRRFSSRIQYLGMQDAPRKFRPPAQEEAGAWAGTIFRIDPNTITKSVTQEKWDKGRKIILDLKVKCEKDATGRPMLNRKDLERSTGFLNHLTMTFEDVTPYLKGFYLSLNSWRPQRDADDWKISDKKWKQVLFDRHDRGLVTDMEMEGRWPEDPNAPSEVKASTRFSSDIQALSEILRPLTAPRVSLRSKRIISVVYGFGDASGTGLGATFTCGSGFNFRIGVWGCVEKDESSNWKEFSNIVDALEDEAKEGNLEDTEVFMFTDNSTVESCAVKGSSSSPKLLSLIIRLRSITTRHGVKLHIFHVAGTRMIAQGTDGVSRGYLALGVMAGEAMSAFIPIHRSCVERSNSLEGWLKGWCGSKALLLLPKEWFGEGHDIGGWTTSPDGFERPILKEGRTYIWSPPPFAADIALAELRKARIKRQTSTHIFVCPRLCTSLWIKQLYKASDIVIEIPAGTSRGNYEAPQKCMQWVGNCEVCSVTRTWTQAIFCANFGCNVTGLGVCQKLWCGKCYTCAPTPNFHIAGESQSEIDDEDEDRMQSGWSSKKVDGGRFRAGRNGDDLLVPFECDFCIFGKLYQAVPNACNPDDVYSMACIRRISLDAFWSRSTSTVLSNAAQIRHGLRHSASIRLSGPYYPPGPLPSHDHCGYEVALQMVLASLEKGVYSSNHKQWDTIRKLRTCFSNQIRAAAVANFSSLSLADAKGSTYQRLAADPCGSLWFNRFMAGCKKRMGQDWRPNRALSAEIMGELLASVERRVRNSDDMEARHNWIMAGGYYCFCYVVSLRGSEGLLADLEGLIEHFDPEGTNVIIPLLGRFKGEDHSTQHLMHCVNSTDSGINVRMWIVRLMAVHRSKGRSKGPVFIGRNGTQATSGEMNAMLLDRLGDIFEVNSSLFGPDVRSVDDIADKYHVFRSFRRGSESRAVAQKVSEADRYVVNRWRRKETAGAGRVHASNVIGVDETFGLSHLEVGHIVSYQNETLDDPSNVGVKIVLASGGLSSRRGKGLKVLRPRPVH